MGFTTTAFADHGKNPKTRFLNVFTAVFLLALFFISTIALQAQSEKKLTDLSLEEMLNIDVVTASQKSQKISDAPATVLSFSAEQIRQYGWKDLKDIFKALPGFDVSYDNEGEIRTSVTMRGIVGNQKILVLQDGLRYNPTTGERVVYANNTPLNIYKRIEIVYGPASALYGADAYSGVINMITNDGADVNGVTVNTGYVSTNAVAGDITFGKKIDDKTDFIISGRVYQGQDAKINEGYADYSTAVNSYKGALGLLNKSYPIHDWNLFTKLKYGAFTFGADWQHELETNAPTTIPTNYAYVENDVWGQDVRHLYVSYNTSITEKAGLTATISTGDYEINPASNFYVIQDAALSTGAPSYKYGYSGYVKGNVQSDIQLADNVSVITGLSYERVKSFPKTQNLANGPFHLDGKLEDDLTAFVDPSGYTYGIVGLSEGKFGERNYNNVGYFLQGDIAALANLHVTLGGRYDYNSIYGETINPRAGIVYKPAEKTSVKALYGTAYIAPSNYYRWENWANPFALHIPNLDLKPETEQSVSLSVTQYVSDNVSVRVEVFQNNLKDVIAPVAAGPQAGNHPYYNPLAFSGKPYESFLDSPGGYFVEINANQGEIKTQGIEVEGSYKLGKLVTNLSYSYTGGDDNGANLPKVSPHKVVLNSSYATSDYSVALTARYYSDVQTAVSNSMYAGKTFTGATLLYFNCSYNLTPALALKLSADNLLNTKAYASAPYGESVWIQPRAPQPLRTVYVGLGAAL
jgi:outer membrane receptor for ferrienterochelin and colicin